MLTDQQKECLLTIARESLQAATRAEPYEPVCDDPALRQSGAAFVTLRKQGELRGCIGCIHATEPLYQVVAKMARSAALEDFRFLPVGEREVRDIHIEISVLTVPQRVQSIQEIKVGTHGLIVQQGSSRGLLLPQVASEWGWGTQEFLEHTCEKAGLPRDAWRKGAAIFAFSAEVFGEEE
jgi:AmmeMemoRadiSam system protein A